MAAEVRAGGREFSDEIIERIRNRVAGDPELTRTALSREVCEWLSWKQANGRLREVSCRVALNTLERRGVLKLPVSRMVGGAVTPRRTGTDCKSEYVLVEPTKALTIKLSSLGAVELLVVNKECPEEYLQWREALERFHPQGCVTPPQAHVRYLIRCDKGVLGALLFSAAARHVADRDAHIGWSGPARVANRELVIANSRFVLLPWVKVKDLASHVLGKAARQVAQDWQDACGLRPVLMETYVDSKRYRATCYRAAGWKRVGRTRGRSRNDRSHEQQATVRSIYLLPLSGDYKRRLCSEPIARRVHDREERSNEGWVRRELNGVDLGDPRRNERLVTVVESFYEKPNASIPVACQHGSGKSTWGQLKGAYRLLNNEKVALSKILAPHYASTAERMAGEEVVLAAQDTTSLNYSTHPETKGLGTVGSRGDAAIGLQVHDTMAFTPQGVPLGLLDVQVWARDPKEYGKKHTRNKRPIEDKESYKWLESFQAAAHAQRLCPNTRVVSVGDRESDVYELFDLALSRDDHPALLVRASVDRCVDRSVRGARAIGNLWEEVESQPAAGVREVAVPRKGKQGARQAHLTLRFCKVSLRPPRNGPSGRKSVEVWAVLAREENPPSGIEALTWMLLTTIKVSNFDEAMEKLDWYAQRWGIEVYHHTLKSGCLIEERQFGSATGLTNCLAVDMIIAWRILYLTRLGRNVPDLPCTAVFTEDEWQSLYAVSHPGKPLPAQPPSLNQVIDMLGKLGGHIGRNSDASPGVKSLWIGLGRLADFVLAWRAFGPGSRGP